MSVCESSSEASGFPGVTHGIPASYTTGAYPFAGYGGQPSYHYGAPFPPMYGAPMHMSLPPHMIPPHMSAHMTSAHVGAHMPPHMAHGSYGFPQPPPLHSANAVHPAKKLRRTSRSDRASLGHIPTPFSDLQRPFVKDDEINGADGPSESKMGLGSSGGDPAYDELSWGFFDSESNQKLATSAGGKNDDDSLRDNNDLTSDLDVKVYPEYSNYPHHPLHAMASPYHHPAYYQPHPLYSQHFYKQRHADAAAMARRARAAATREALLGRSLNVKPAAGALAEGKAAEKGARKRSGSDGLEVDEPEPFADCTIAKAFDEQFVANEQLFANEPCAVVPSASTRSGSLTDLPLVPSSPSVPVNRESTRGHVNESLDGVTHYELPAGANRDAAYDFSVTRFAELDDRVRAAPPAEIAASGAALHVAPSLVPIAVSSPTVPSAVLSAAASIPRTIDPKRRRLLRNRVSAQQAREKKKYYITGLEGREAVLKAENEKLEATIAALTRENAELRTRLRRRVVPA